LAATSRKAQAGRSEFHAELLSKILHLFSLIISVLSCTPRFAAVNNYAAAGHSGASGTVKPAGSCVENSREVLYYISRSLRSTSMHRFMPRSEVSIVQRKRAATAQIRMSTAPH
jgi:hypothetical protein